MSGLGSVENPYRETPFDRIVAVGWPAGAVVIVEVVVNETKFYDVESINPPDVLADFFVGTEIHEDDYKEAYILRMGFQGPEGTVLVEDALDDIWIWDGLHTGAIGDEPANSEAVADGTALFGYAPNLHLTGQQVEYNQNSPPSGPYGLGNIVEHTHPNGSIVRYRSGYTAISHGPQFDAFGQPFGDFDFSGTESWYWYRVTSQPESTAAILRNSYLVNIRKNFVRSAQLIDFGIALDSPLDWSIKGYPAGTGFTIAESAIMTPIGPVVPTFSASGSVGGGHEGIIRKFNGSGFIA